MSDLAPLRWLVALWFGATAAVPMGLLGVLLSAVAFGFAHEHEDIFRWTDVVAISVWVAAIGAVVAIVFGRAALGVLRGRTWVRWLLGLEGALAVVVGRADARWVLLGLSVMVLAALLPSTPDCPRAPTSGMLSACR